MSAAGEKTLFENIDMWFGVIGAALFVVTLLLLLWRSVWPAWVLLGQSLHDSGWRRFLAIFDLLGLLGLGVQTRSLYKAVRLRIESELVVPPPPERPLRFTKSKKEYREAFKEFRSACRQRREELRSPLIAMRFFSEDVLPTFEVDTCAPLLENKRLDHYFDALQARYPEESPSFLSRVAISSGFVAPLHLLTGVLAHYDEQWQPVVEGYGKSVIQSDDPYRRDPLRRIQSFIFDCWILWGPSIPVCSCPQWQGEVALQYGYGDENNSLTLRCSSPEIVRPLLLADGEKPVTTITPRRFAARIRVTGTLRSGQWLHRRDLCPAQRAIWEDERLVLDVTDAGFDLQAAGGTQEQVNATYYSAYLWVALVMCSATTGEPLHPAEPWRNLIPFFEHGNIAHPAVYDFHKNQLAVKALEGALRLLADNHDLVLRLVAAIDEPGCGYDLIFPTAPSVTISNKMRDLLEERRALIDPHGVSDRLILQWGDRPWRDGDYSSCAMPDILKDFYDSGEGGVMFREIRLSRPGDKDLLCRLYSLMEEEFLPDERESLTNITRYLQKKVEGEYGQNNYHVIVALDQNDTPIGGSISDYLVQANAGVIEFLFVHNDRRARGVGRRLLEETERLLHGDAERAGRRINWIAGELDDPFVSPLVAGFDPFVRARIWHAWGYAMLDLPYVQPALADDKQPVSNLLLMAKLCSSRTAEDGESEEILVEGFDSDDIRKLVQEYFRLAMRIKVPADNKEFRAINRYLDKHKKIPVIPLSRYVGSGTPHLTLVEVAHPDDADLEATKRLHETMPENTGSQVSPASFSQLLRDALSPAGGRLHPHLWSIRHSSEAPCEGYALFMTLPSAGWLGQLVLTSGLDTWEMRARLMSRMEEWMLRDHRDALGWYVECGEAATREAFLEHGLVELDVPYLTPDGRAKHLLYKPFGRVYEPPTLRVQDLISSVRDWHKWGYTAATREAASAVAAAINERLDGHDFVPLAPPESGQWLSATALRRSGCS